MIEVKEQGKSIELFIDGLLWMSNQPQEIKNIERVVKTAKGNCFVGGLGLGLVVQELLKIREVEHVDVVEINREVIETCSRRVIDKRVSIYEGNAKTFFPNSSYDWIYYDIWLSPTLEEIEECKTASFPYLKDSGVFEFYKEE